MSREQDSQAYIVRIWRSGSDDRWCFSIQDVSTGERYGFADLDSFLAYFYTIVRDPPDAQDKATGDAGPADAAPPERSFWRPTLK